MIKKLIAKTLLFGGLLLLANKNQADTPALILQGTAPNQAGTFEGSRGWQFVWGGPISISALGVFDYNGDGLEHPHQVGLWSVGTAGLNLVASVTVPAGTGAELIGGYRYAPITPVSFNLDGPQITQFAVAAQFSAGDSDDAFVPIPSPQSRFYPGIFGVYGLGPNLPTPDRITGASCEGCNVERFWEPNFQYSIVPEPGSATLFAAGAVIMLLYKRRLPRSRPSPSNVPIDASH